MTEASFGRALAISMVAALAIFGIALAFLLSFWKTFSEEKPNRRSAAVRFVLLVAVLALFCGLILWTSYR